MIVFRAAFSDPAKRQLRQQFHADHKAYIRDAPFRVLASGPAFRPGSEDTAAALLIADVSTVAELEAFSAGDPFVVHGVYRQVAIFEWRPGIDLTNGFPNRPDTLKQTVYCDLRRLQFKAKRK